MSTRLTQSRLRQIIKEELSRVLREGDPKKDASDREYADYLQQQHGHFTSPENLPASMRPHRQAASDSDRARASAYSARASLGMSPEEEEFYASYMREAEKKSKEVSDDPDEMNEMDMMGDEEEEFARRPSEQMLDLEKYAPKIMKNQRLAMYSRDGGFAVTDVVELYAREMARDLEEMGVEVDPVELDRMIHEEVHDMLDILAVEGELNLDPQNPNIYTFVRMPKMRRLGPR